MRGIKQAVAMLIAILCITAVSASGGINPVSIGWGELNPVRPDLLNFHHTKLSDLMGESPSASLRFRLM